MKKFREYALIVAGGTGTRMNSKIPKQFLKLGSIPVLMHTILAFHEYARNMYIVLVLPEKYIPYWKSLCAQYRFSIPVHLAVGGQTRFQSVRNGLKLIKGDGIVAIHDGVRPLIDRETISNSFAAASSKGSAVTAIWLKDSIRKIEKDISLPLDRSEFCLIQTPQTFRVPKIKKAYECRELPLMTDDAIVFERAGYKVYLVPGFYTNIKITTAEDLVIAKALLKNRDPGPGRLSIRPR
ncbi:MAG TPA: 2-C-methyl-D-erythritol 4-phosphate cytidylyltransferase [Cyclobacteriaceae bacterium]|nr:2-C-methyl-D-erythritol 4-phosphate cytidylyltransferase [Cyclobacteriaceae bacterium]